MKRYARLSVERTLSQIEHAAWSNVPTSYWELCAVFSQFIASLHATLEGSPATAGWGYLIIP